MRTEKTFALILLASLILRVFGIPGASMLIVFASLALTLLYFPGAFYFFSDRGIKNQNIALSISSGIFFSLTPIALMHKMLHWNNGEVYALFSTISSLLILIIIYKMKSKANETLFYYYKNMFMRTLIIAIVS
jgi:hypothetical protein